MVDLTTDLVVTSDYHHLSTELETAWGSLRAPGVPDLYPLLHTTTPLRTARSGSP